MYSIEISKNGYPTLKFNESYIHSRYNPVLEGLRLTKTLDIDNKNCIIVFGMGLGYHIMPLLELGIRILVIEKNPDIINCLRQVGYTNRFSSIHLYTGDVLGIELWLSDRVSEGDSVIFFDHNPSSKLDTHYYNTAKNIAYGIIKSNIHSYITSLGFSKRWHENVIKNVIHLNRFLKVNKNVDMPVFIIGSGPTLDQNIDKLAKIKNKGILICLAPSYRRLLASNIIPDFVISTDGGIANRMHISGHSFNNKSILITSLSVSTNIINTWKGNILIINNGLTIEDYLLDDFIKIPMQGTVASAAFLFAKKLFRGSVFLFGIDFAFTNGLYHHKGAGLESKILFTTNKLSPFENKYYKLITGFNISTVKNYSGKDILTSLPMESYLRWFSREVLNGDRDVYVVGNNGAKIDGVKNITTEELCLRYDDVDKDKMLKPMVNSLSINEINRIKERVFKLYQGYMQIKKEIRNNYEAIYSLLEKDSEKAIGQIFSFQNMRLIKKLKRNNLSTEDYNDFSYSINRTLNILKRSISGC